MASGIRRANFQPLLHNYEINPKADPPAYVPYDPTPVYQDWARTRTQRRPNVEGASSSNFFISVGTEKGRRKRTKRNESDSS